jgi:hypothetical protein
MADDDNVTDNVTLWDNAGDREVSIITDGADERLAVDAALTSGNFQLQPFLPDFHFDVAGTILNTSTDTVLYEELGRGKIDFICIVGSNSNYEVVIEADGTEVIRISMADLGSSLGLANATNVPIWVETANKNFRYSPKQGVDFTTGYKLLAKATSTPLPTLNWLINDRKEA